MSYFLLLCCLKLLNISIAVLGDVYYFLVMKLFDNTAGQLTTYPGIPIMDGMGYAYTYTYSLIHYL